jgi:hypothetical protein
MEEECLMLRRLVVCGAACLSLGFLPAAAAAEGCPNEQLRVENHSTQLPDCRAYEKVSPADKNGEDVRVNIGLRKASSSGEAVTFATLNASGDSRGAPFAAPFIARRQAEGWVTHGIAVPHEARGALYFGGRVYDTSEDLTKWAFDAGEPLLVSEAPPGVTSLYTHDSATGRDTLVTPVGPPGGPNPIYQPIYTGASEDLSHVLFETSEALLPEAPQGVAANLYETTGGVMRLVGILPDGSVAPGGAAAGGTPVTPGLAPPAGINPISRDGSHVFFSSPAEPSDPTRQVYVRIDAAKTVEVSKSQRTVPDPNGPQPAVFRAASPDGTKVLFTSAAELTDDANTGSADEGADLYEYDIASKTLVDLTVDSNVGDTNGAQVQGIMGVSDNGAYVYVVALGALAPGASSGQPNLYVVHNGEPPRLVATLSPGDSEDWSGPNGASPGSRFVTPDGTHLAFPSLASPTGYENAGHSEVYLYDATGEGHLVCVSCHAGAVATGDATLGGMQIGNFASKGPPRGISDDGRRVFFNTPEPLVAGDVNGHGDVYEYENGAAHLLSSGQGALDSTFFEASASGGDVFFVTRDQLLSSDRDVNVDLYDARENGGFPQTSSAGATCLGEQCGASASPPPAFTTPGSLMVTGSGNLAPVVSKPAVKSSKKRSKQKGCRKHTRKRNPRCPAKHAVKHSRNGRSQ